MKSWLDRVNTLPGWQAYRGQVRNNNGVLMGQINHTQTQDAIEDEEKLLKAAAAARGCLQNAPGSFFGGCNKKFPKDKTTGLCCPLVGTTYEVPEPPESYEGVIPTAAEVGVIPTAEVVGGGKKKRKHRTRKHKKSHKRHHKKSHKKTKHNKHKKKRTLSKVCRFCRCKKCKCGAKRSKRHRR